MTASSQVVFNISIADDAPLDCGGRKYSGHVSSEDIGIELKSEGEEASFRSPFAAGESIVKFKSAGLLAINIVRNKKGTYIYGSYQPGYNVHPMCTTCCGQTVCGGGHICNGQECKEN